MTENAPDHNNIGWRGLDRERARKNPEEFPEELRAGLEVALNHLQHLQKDNYDNPRWEPAIGFLEAAIDGTYPGG